MAMLPGAGIGSARPQPMSEINVTPLVDVMLVLLIIFMITAPLASAGVHVDLPQNKARQLTADQKPIEVSIDGAGQIYLGDIPVVRQNFGPSMAQLAASASDPENARIFVRADRTLDYGFVMGVVSEVSAAGFTKVAFLSDSRPIAGAKATP